MPTEYRFFCPELQREVSTAECYDRGDTGRTCYGECCAHVEQAVLTIAQTRLQAAFGDRIATEYRTGYSHSHIMRLHREAMLQVVQNVRNKEETI